MAELELEVLGLQERIELFLMFAGLCVESCGGVLFFGAGSLHVRGSTGYIGIALILGGIAEFGLMAWLLRPRTTLKHAAHRLRHHARKLQPAHRHQDPPLTDAEFDAVEDAVDRSARNVRAD